MSFRLPDDVKAGLQAIAAKHDLSMSDVIVKFCRDGLKNCGNVKTLNPTLYTIEQN